MTQLAWGRNWGKDNPFLDNAIICMNMYKDSSANVFTRQKREFQNITVVMCVLNIHLRKMQITIKKVLMYSIKFWLNIKIWEVTGKHASCFFLNRKSTICTLLKFKLKKVSCTNTTSNKQKQRTKFNISLWWRPVNEEAYSGGDLTITAIFLVLMALHTVWFQLQGDIRKIMSHSKLSN